MSWERAAKHLLPATAAFFQILTLRWTWDLWFARADPPNLPAIDGLADVSWGWPLVAACVATMVRPKWGAPVFCALYALAALGDQMRLQPGVVSLAFLMTAPAFGVTGRSIARWHLCSVWLWAGIHKLMSPEWPDESAAFIASSLDQEGWRSTVAVLLPLFEIAVGLVALWPRTWRLAAVGGVALHLGIFFTLSPMFGDWNSAVWPWNLAAAVAAAVLFWPSADTERRPFPTRPATIVGAALLAYPALFYAGAIDTYLSHNLYSSNVSRAAICNGDSELCYDGPFGSTIFTSVNVPMPPEPRLYRQWFDELCQPGQELMVTERHTRFTDPPDRSRHPCV